MPSKSGRKRARKESNAEVAQQPPRSNGGDDDADFICTIELPVIATSDNYKVTVTPWKSYEELESVASILCQCQHVDLDKLGQALDRASLWQQRENVLPHAVETTIALARAYYRDRQVPKLQSYSELCYMFGAIVVRAVNGLADVMQQDMKSAASVLHLCRSIGLPDYCVDIRHNMTHQNLPSLCELRLAASGILTFLQQVYWDPIMNMRNEYEQHIRSVLDEYKSIAETDLLQVYQQGLLMKENDRARISETMATIDNVDDDPDSHLFAESDNEDYSDDIFLGASRTLGSNVNRFSALFDAPKKKVSKTTKSTITKTAKKQSKEDKYTKRIRRTRNVLLNSAQPKLADCIKRLLEHQPPFDVVCNTIKDFLTGSDGVMLCSNPVNSTDTATNNISVGDDKIIPLRYMYEPLLVVIAQTWPLLANQIFVTLVRQVSHAPKTISARQRLSFDWIQVMLSPKFKEKVQSSSTTSIPVTHELFPTCKLYDYCVKKNKDDDLLVNELIETLQFNGSTGAHNDDQMETEVYEDEKKDDDHTKLFSLDDIESLLSGNKKVEAHSVIRTKTTELTRNDGPVQKVKTTASTERPAWALCTDWTPCALGTLPMQFE